MATPEEGVRFVGSVTGMRRPLVVSARSPLRRRCASRLRPRGHAGDTGGWGLRAQAVGRTACATSAVDDVVSRGALELVHAGPDDGAGFGVDQFEGDLVVALDDAALRIAAVEG